MDRLQPQLYPDKFIRKFHLALFYHIEDRSWQTVRSCGNRDPDDLRMGRAPYDTRHTAVQVFAYVPVYA